MDLINWAIRWQIPPAALDDLRAGLGLIAGAAITPPTKGTSEAAVQAAVRLEAARKGCRLFRNNVGALTDERGVPVRYGLANDSKQVNERIKSADLIGWRRRLITPDMVGSHIAQFLSREIKELGWQYAATPREQAQAAWAGLVLADGGDAGFAAGEGTL